MKNLILYVTFTVLSAVSFSNISAKTRITPQAQGEIIFIRNTGISGCAIPFSTFIDANLASKINENCYSKHLILAGMHEFSVQYYGK